MAAVRRKRQKKPGWYLIAGVIAIVCALAFMRAGRDLWQIWRLSRMKTQEQRALDNAVEAKRLLEREIDMLRNDPDYIERIAREEYGMVKEGEEVYHLPRGGVNDND